MDRPGPRGRWLLRDRKVGDQGLYQARLDVGGNQQPILLGNGMWYPSMARAQEVCEADRKDRQRDRIAAKAKRPATAPVMRPPGRR